MATYEITSPDGRTIELEWDSPPTEQELEQVFAELPRELPKETKQALAEREKFEKSYREQAKEGAVSKGIGLAGGIIKGGIVEPVAAMAKGAIELPGMFEKAVTTGDVKPLVSTPLEAGRRIGMDIIDLARKGIPASYEITQEARKKGFGNPLLGLPFALYEKLLKPKDATPEEVQKAYEEFIAEKPYEEVRREVPKEGIEGEVFGAAQPQVAEGLAKGIETIVPIGRVAKGLKPILTYERVLLKAPKQLRKAIAPAKEGTKLEAALGRQFDDIYRTEPKAHIKADSEIEGFAQSVDKRTEAITQRLNDLRSQVGPQPYGREIATSLNAKADEIAARGGTAEEILALRQRATEMENAVTDVNSLQNATTHAGRKVDWNAPRTSAQKIADETIQRKGSEILNRELEAVGGPEGATIRKDWADLKIIHDNLEKTVNKFLNSLPADSRPAVIQGLSSTKGVAGLFGLLNGYSSGALGVIAGIGEAVSKNARKALKDPNAIVRKLYNELDKTKPKEKKYQGKTPPVIGEVPTLESKAADAAQRAQRLREAESIKSQALQESEAAARTEAQQGMESMAQGLAERAQRQRVVDAIIKQDLARQLQEGRAGLLQQSGERMIAPTEAPPARLEQPNIMPKEDFGELLSRLKPEEAQALMDEYLRQLGLVE